MREEVVPEQLPFPPELPLHFIGAGREAGPLPGILYFSLSASESLSLHPYNQPALFLHTQPLRIFSLTLPGHGEGFDKHQAMAYWAEEMEENPSLLEDFFEQAKKALQQLVAEGLLLPGKIGLMGLSRGAFIATHLAARMEEKVKGVVGFAPLTDLTFHTDFQPILHREHIQEFALSTIARKVMGIPIRFYISNRDTLVNSDLAFQFIRKVADESYDAGIRTPPAECIVYPRIGREGHGTPTKIFHEGAQWLMHQLLQQEDEE